jgi:hypothetical protein
MDVSEENIALIFRFETVGKYNLNADGKLFSAGFKLVSSCLLLS